MPIDTDHDLDADVARLDPEPIDLAAESEKKSVAKASLYLRAIRSLDRERGDIEERYAEERRRIDGWRDDMLAGMEERRGQLVRLLEGFGRAWKERTGHAPKRLPYGRITLTPPKPSLIVVDEEAFKDWAEGNGRLDLLRIKVEPDKDAVKAALLPAGAAEVPSAEPDKRYQALRTPEGEPVPGVALATPTQDSVNVKVE